MICLNHGRYAARKPAALLALAAAVAAGLALLPGRAADPGARGPAVALRHALAHATSEKARGLSFFVKGKTYEVINLEFNAPGDCEKFADRAKANGCHVFNRYDEFADVMVLPNDAKAVHFIEDSPGLKAADLAGPAYVPPPSPFAVEKPKGIRQPEKIVHGGLGGLTGKGVIVAVIDSGLDFRHDDFIKTEDGKKVSRLLCFWDTTRQPDGRAGTPGPVQYPDGRPIGTVYSRDDLTRDLRGEIRLQETGDENGHGTGCAGIAAGSGSAARAYQGVAPEADLIAVRIGGQGEDLSNGYLLTAACGWLEGVAREQGRPLVVSCSFGGHTGRGDGSRVEERQLSKRFAADVPGRLICLAAGNEGSENIHATAAVAPQKPARLSWDARVPGDMLIFVDGARPGDVKLEPADGTRLKFDDRQDQEVSALAGTLLLHVAVPRGRGALQLSTPGSATFLADAYFPEWMSEKESIRFADDLASNARLILTPGAALGAITVGSYDFNDQFDYENRTVTVPNLETRRLLDLGGLSDYSNGGYVRGSGNSLVVKPEVVAPGRYHTVPLAQSCKPFFSRDTTGRYQLFDGTSAATPYVAGVAALVLEKKPTLTPGEFRKLLADNLTRDGKRAADYPNPSWGYGKLDYAAVERIIAAVR